MYTILEWFYICWKDMDSTLTVTSVTIDRKYIQKLESLYRQEHTSTFQSQEKIKNLLFFHWDKRWISNRFETVKLSTCQGAAEESKFLQEIRPQGRNIPRGAQTTIVREVGGSHLLTAKQKDVKPMELMEIEPPQGAMGSSFSLLVIPMP